MSVTNVIKSLKTVASELIISREYSEANRLEDLCFKLSNLSGIIVDEKLREELTYVVQNCTAPRGYIDIGGGSLDMETWANLLNTLASDITKTFTLYPSGLGPT